MDSPSVPQSPDPKVVAGEQGKLNTDAARLTAQLARPNQVTPFGSLTWEQGAPTKTFNQSRYDAAVAAAQQAVAAAQQAGGGTPQPIGYEGGNDFLGFGGTPYYGVNPDGSYQYTPPSVTPGVTPDRNDPQFYDEKASDSWTSRVTLDPRVQAVLDAQLKTSQGLNTAVDNSLQQVNDAFAKPIDYNALPPAPSADEAARKRVEDALYGRYTSRLDPRFKVQENRLRSDLMNRGLVEGSEAWKTAMDNFNRDKTDAYQTATQEAVGHGGEEMSRYFGLESTARQNALAEQERKRALVLNELNSLRGGQQVSMPTFGNGATGATVNPAPIAQAMQNAYQGQLGAYSSGVASNNNMMGTLGSLGSAYMMSGGLGGLGSLGSILGTASMAAPVVESSLPPALMALAALA